MAARFLVISFQRSGLNWLRYCTEYFTGVRTPGAKAIDCRRPGFLLSRSEFERLDEDWAVVAKKLGINESLPHRRANPRERHYTEYYDARTREVIANKFRIDIEHFGYEFGG
jgi:hypothetical protein